MKIVEFKATSGYSGLLIGVHNWYDMDASVCAYKTLAEKAFAIYRKRIDADPYLEKYAMRFCIWEYETDKDGIFRTKKTIYRDFRLIDGNIVMVKEQIFIK